MAQITYADKVGINPKEVHINQVWDDDMNEIKTVVNGIDTFSFELENSILTNQQNIDSNLNRIGDLEARNAEITYTTAEINRSIRKSLNPYSYVSYLPIATPFTTPSIVANTPTKILIPTTIKSSNAWAVADIGGGVLAFLYTGLTTETFKVYMTTSMTTGTNNVVFEVFMYKNGILEPGITISRKVSSGADVGAIAVIGEFVADPSDYVEIYVKVDLASTVTFSKTSIMMTEKN